MLTILALLALAAAALYVAPAPTIGAGAVLAAILHPWFVPAAVTVALAVAVAIVWRSLSGTGWRVVLVTAHLSHANAVLA